MPDPTPPHRPAILIVEDEPLLLMDAVDIVLDAGFKAYEATSAAQAIAILERADDIVLVFTDVQLAGGVDGLKLARMVRDRWPPIKLLVSSGRAVVREEDLPPAALFLPKPYRAGDVHRLLDRLLEIAR
ncbi:response regulator [Aureimonas endophytica]|uniref:Response regulator n=1 Tax=Aureimonas endophytica TaxID=2027858 RepID=A0A916ZQ44_9HYPH|nr:response regulator [Aureimonas endophytica]GGE07248.1 response regulator [Aureimonas endophytica]